MANSKVDRVEGCRSVEYTCWVRQPKFTVCCGRDVWHVERTAITDDVVWMELWGPFHGKAVDAETITDTASVVVAVSSCELLSMAGSSVMERPAWSRAVSI